MDCRLVNTGIDAIGSVPWGIHFCQFYQTQEDLLHTLVPYFTAGLENNEFCMWITADPLTVHHAEEAMRGVLPDFDERLAKGQIELMPHTEWYLKGGTFDLDRVLNGWVEKLGSALEEGYQGLRVTGNTAWLERKDWDNFADYEAAINGVIGKHRMMALCTYSLDTCNAADVIDVIRNHEFALIRKEGKWEVIENAIYKRTKESLAQSEDRLQRILEELPVGVELYDSDGRLVSANAACLRIFGVSEFEDIKGYSLLEDANVPEEMKLQLHRGQAARFVSTFDFDKVRKHNLYNTTRTGIVHLDLTVTPITSLAGQPLSGYLAQVQDVTERKRVADELLRSQGLIEAVTEGTGVIMAAQDKEHRYTYFNKAYQEEIKRLTGRDLRLGDSMIELFAGMPDQQKTAVEEWSRTLRGETFTRRVEFGDPGRFRTVYRLFNTPIRDQNGNIVGAGQVAFDVGQQVRMEEDLLRSRERLKKAQEIAHLGSWELDVLNNHLEWSDEVYRIFGLVPHQFGATYEAFLDAVHPDDRRAVDEAYSASLRDGRDTYEFEHRVVRKSDGAVRFVHEKCEHIRDESGRVLRSMGMVHDITERKETEWAVQTERQQLFNMLEVMPMMVCLLTPDHHVAFANRAFREKFGESQGRHCYEYCFGKEEPCEFCQSYDVLKTGEPHRWEVKGPDGSVIDAYDFPFADPDGLPMILELDIDITERNRAEEQLVFQANILSHIFSAVLVLDNDGRVTYWNEVAEGLYGIPADQAIGHRVEELYKQVWLNPSDEQDAMRDLAGTGHWTGECFHVKRNGDRAYVRSSVSVMNDQTGRQTGMVAVIRDRTKWWRAEQEVKLLNEKLRQQAEDRLRATDTSFRRAISSSADGVFVVGKDGVIRFANPAAEAMFGRMPGGMVGTLFKFPLAEGSEITISRDDGGKSTAEMRVVELEWEGTPAYLATLRDITRRKEGLLALQESETRLRLLLDQIPCVSWTVDNRLRFASFTGSGVGVFRIAPAEVLGKTLVDYFKVDSTDFPPYVAHRQALRGTPANYELNWAGRTFYGCVESLRDVDQHILGVVGVAFDITDRKRAEEQLRNLSHRLVKAQEEERLKIARELHDEVGQSLTALKLSLDKISSSKTPGDGSELGEAREALRELVARVRSMSLELRPTMLDDLGLLPTLRWHFKRYTAQTNVQVNFKHRGLRKDMPEEAVTAAYRIVQEALTNVARHAKVNEVLVCVRAESDALVVEVEDQGVGFDEERVPLASMGLNGMRERALSLKGKLLVQSRPGEGTCVIAELPLQKRGRKGRRSRRDDHRSSG